MGSLWPSLGAAKMRRLLERELGYTTASHDGTSHRRMTSSDPRCRPITFSFHDGKEIPAVIVGKILVKDVGLSRADAQEVVKRA